MTHRPSFGPHLDVAALSHAGAGLEARGENQDNYLLIDMTGHAIFLRDQEPTQHYLPDWPPGHARVAVLDGMGGHGHGREAAEAVVQGLIALPACATLQELSSQLDELHARLQARFGDASPDKRPGTTLTMLELRPGLPPLLYHVGDSRLYEVRPDRVTPITVDHVPATAFAMAGLIDEHEWWQQVHGEHRSQISQAFILGNAFANPAQLSDALYELSPRNLPPFLYHLPDRRALELAPDALYVLATDGFWACADPFGWLAQWPGLLNGKSSAEEMVEALFHAIEHDPPLELHSDNLTAIVLRPKEH